MSLLRHRFQGTCFLTIFLTLRYTYMQRCKLTGMLQRKTSLLLEGTAAPPRLARPAHAACFAVLWRAPSRANEVTSALGIALSLEPAGLGALRGPEALHAR